MNNLSFVLLVAGGAGALVLVRRLAQVWDEQDLRSVRAQAYALGRLQAERDARSASYGVYHPDAPLTPTGPYVPVALPVAHKEPVRLGPLKAVPGQRYRAAVDVSVSADAGDVRKQTEKKGFRDVVVSSTRPPDWPSGIETRWYVDGVYAGGPTTFDRSYALGLVKIREVFEG